MFSKHAAQQHAWFVHVISRLKKIQQGSSLRVLLSVVLIYMVVFQGAYARADDDEDNEPLGNDQFQVQIEGPSEIRSLARKHLDIVQAITNPRFNRNEWYRLIRTTPREIEKLAATAGFFSTEVKTNLSEKNGKKLATFTVETGPPASIAKINLNFVGDFTQQEVGLEPDEDDLRAMWGLPEGARFSQEAWDTSKRKLVNALSVKRYPNASIRYSRAEVDLKENLVNLNVTIDSGPRVKFGEFTVSGLSRYPENVVRNLNPIEPGDDYDQARLLQLHADLQSSGYFSNVQLDADTEQENPVGIEAKLTENQSQRLGVGVGASTNTGARTQLTYDSLNLFNRGWRLNSSLRIEQRAQSINAVINRPTTKEGYRDSFNSNLFRQSIEGQVLTAINTGAKRTWGPLHFEQSIGANYLIENEKIDGAPDNNRQAATVSYGLTIRRINDPIMPTKGYLFNLQFTGAPVEALAEGTFLRSYSKLQAYYPLTSSTQLTSRMELGAVSGGDTTPATYLFRTGGDNSVRGYAFQSLGVGEGDAVIGGRYLFTGSIEVTQWLTEKWGVALFTDFGNAANTVNALDPVFGYGLGARWKSPAGPLGVDIAYGEATGDYRLHFNLGVNF